MTDLPFMTTSEAASLLSVHPETVRRMCEAGDLQAQFERGIWFIDRQSVNRLQKNADRRQERITRERVEHAKRITQVVKTCPRCGLKVRGPGAFRMHTRACKRLWQRIDDEPVTDDWWTDDDERWLDRLRRLRREAGDAS